MEKTTNLRKNKSDFTDIYNHPTCLKFYKELMKKKGLEERNEILAKYSQRTLLPLFREWNEKLGKPLKMVDFLCCYRNDSLSIANFFHIQDFENMWGSEDTCYTLSKPRQFSVETFGCDISANACEYGKRAGIFDDVMVADLNSLDEMQRNLLRERCEKANILIMNSFSYLNEGGFKQIMEWFESGTEPGIIIVGFSFCYQDQNVFKEHKNFLLDKFNFFSSVPSKYRELDEDEKKVYGPAFGTWTYSFNETWFLTRKLK